jgi:ABC-type branched-subunit amino acid transport system substrate-binding protein
MRNGIFHLITGTALAIALSASSAYAQKKYDSGASDTEIKIGQTVPFSGPASAYASIGKTQAAYIKMINDQGGVNGRKVELIQYDDAYSPPKAVEQVRKLVESDEVLLTFQIIGTPSNAAVQKYLNAKKVPQLFAATGASKFTDPKNFPWTLGFNPNYFVEGRIYGQYILKNYPNAKVGVLYQNDDLGKDFRAGFRAGLGDKADSLIVSEQTFEVADPTVDSQVISAKASGANVFYFAGTQKAGAGQLRAVHNLGWKPLQVACGIAGAIETVLKPAGLDNAQGLISTAYAKDPYDPAWAEDADVTGFLAWARDYLKDASPRESTVTNGYVASFLTAYVLEKAGANLTRENILRIATHLDNVHVPMLLPGITASTTPSDYSVINKFQIQRFEGDRWVARGPVISGE